MSLPDHLTPAQVAALLRKPVEEILREVEAGKIKTEEAGIPRDEVAAMLVLEAYRPDEFEYIEGSTNHPLPQRICHDCGEIGGVHYTGTEVLDGLLEHYHLVTTEIENHFRCDRCGSTWKRFKML